MSLSGEISIYIHKYQLTPLRLEFPLHRQWRYYAQGRQLNKTSSYNAKIPHLTKCPHCQNLTRNEA